MNILIKINSLIKYLYYLLFIITPLIMYHKTSEIFEFNKMLFIYFMTINIFGLWLMKMVLFKKIIFKKTFLDIPIFLFFVSQLLSTFLSIDPHTSIFGYYGRFNGGLLSILSYITLYYAFVSNFSDLVNSQQEIKRFVNISIITSILVFLWGLPSKFGYDLTCFLFTGVLNNSCWTEQFKPAERMFSTLGQPNWLAAYLIINFLLSLYFIFKDNDNERNSIFKIVLFFILSLLLFSGILFTRSRSAYIALLITLILFFFFIAIKDKIWKLNFLKTKKYFLLLFFFVCLIFLFKTGVPQIDRFLELNISFNKVLTKSKNFDNQVNISSKTNNMSIPGSEITDSGDIRKIVWRGAIDLGFKYPFFGTGVETFAYSYFFVRPKEHNIVSEWDFIYNKAHNEFLNYFATTGFFGLSTYLLMIFTAIYFFMRWIYNIQVLKDDVIRKSKNKTLINNYFNNQLLIFCFFLAYFSILVTNFFGFSTTTINLYFYLIPGIILMLVSNQDKNKTTQTRENLTVTMKQKILLFLIFLIYLFGLRYIFYYYLADINYSAADNFLKINEYSMAFKKVNNAIILKSDEHVYYDKMAQISANISAYYFLDKSSHQKKEVKKRGEFYLDLAKGANSYTLNASPKNVSYWKTKAKINYLFYQVKENKNYLNESISSLKEAIKLAKTDPRLYYSLAMIFYDDLGQYQEALTLIDQSIELKPNYRDGYYLKGLILKKIGKKEEAKKVFSFILKKINAQDQEVRRELNNL